MLDLSLAVCQRQSGVDVSVVIIHCGRRLLAFLGCEA